MATKLKIKKNAQVEVIAGADKGKKGTVIEIKKTALKVKVSGVRLLTNYDKQDGLVKKEGYIDYSNIKLISNPTEKKAATKRKSAR